MLTNEVMDRLHPIDQRSAELADELHNEVAALRNEGATWVQIGNVLGVTPQAVQQRFRR
jgi:hypothetical protein